MNKDRTSITITLDKSTLNMLHDLQSHNCLGDRIPVSIWEHDRSCSMSSVIRDSIITQWVKVMINKGE